MNEAAISELIESISAKCERRSEKSKAMLDAWLGTLDALGLAWAVKDDHKVPQFRLNAAARKDSTLTPRRLARLSRFGERKLQDTHFFSSGHRSGGHSGCND